MRAFFFLVISLLAHSCTAMENSFIKTIALNGLVKFSPDGKHLLVFEEENVAVYDTNGARKKENLPDLPKEYNSFDGERLFSFSPQGTYATFPKALCHIWNLKTIQKHLADTLIEGDIVWNSPETKFITVPKTRAQPNISRVYATQTGDVLAVIDHNTTHYHIPDYVSLNDDGSLAAFIFPDNGNRRTEIHNLSNGAIFGAGDVQQVAFCPDNIHTLITCLGNQVLVDNKNTYRCLRLYCASSRHMFDGELHTNRLKMHINGLQTIIKNDGNRYERYIITQEGDTFTTAQHNKPFTKEKTIIGNTKSLALIKKNRKVPFSGGMAYYDLYLKRMRESQQEICLLEQVPTFSNGIKFSDAHDEHLLVTDPVKALLYVFSLPSGQQIGKLKFHEIRISPDGHSFVLGDTDEKRTWYILPKAIDTLSKDTNSYFSLLPADIRTYVQSMKTV